MMNNLISIFEKLNSFRKLLPVLGKKSESKMTINEEPDNEYESVNVSKVGVNPFGMEGVVVLKTINEKEFPISAFSEEVAHHISNFLNKKQSISTIYNLVEQISEEMGLFLVKVKLFDGGGAMRANLYFTGKKDLVLRNYRASDAIALATYYHVPILIRKTMLEQVTK